jgi:glycosyltransferase involved in cell wall biosynthesis
MRREGRGDATQIELMDFEFLLPDLRASLEREGFLAAGSGRDATIDVFAPHIPGPIEAAASITASANRWAALRGVPIVIRPTAGRVAHPTTARARAATGTPTVSIALPVFNGERHLAAALDSLLEQSYADFELIICDNASDDGTREICESYVARDDRVRYLGADANRGAAWNYNRGLEAATGRYFKWASHDDLCAPTYLERCVEVLDRASDSVVLAYPKTVLIDDEGRFLAPYEDGLDLRDAQPHRRLQALIRNLVMSNAVFGLIRREALQQTRKHGAYISADYILLAELALLGQFWEIPEPLFLRRDHPSMSRRANRTTAELAEWFETGAGARHRSEFLRLLAEYVSALGRAPLPPTDRLRAFSTLVPWLRRFHRSILRELLAVAPSAAATPVKGAQPHVERISVFEAARDAVWSVAPDFTSHVRIHVDPELSIESDRTGLNTILVNLVSNAVRYGGPPFTIAARRDGGDLTLVVEDEGRGVSSEFVPRLFEPFSRSSESEHASAGLGLGLAVAALKAREANGTLSYEPRAAGARFRLVLPSGPRRSPPAPTTRTALRTAQTALRLYSLAV